MAGKWEWTLYMVCSSTIPVLKTSPTTFNVKTQRLGPKITVDQRNKWGEGRKKKKVCKAWFKKDLKNCHSWGSSESALLSAGRSSDHPDPAVIILLLPFFFTCLFVCLFFCLVNCRDYSVFLCRNSSRGNNLIPGFLNSSSFEISNSFEARAIIFLVVGGIKRLFFHLRLFLSNLFDLHWFNLVWELKVCETSCSELWLEWVAGWMCFTILVSSVLCNDPWFWWVSITCVGSVRQCTHDWLKAQEICASIQTSSGFELLHFFLPICQYRVTFVSALKP